MTTLRDKCSPGQTVVVLPDRVDSIGWQPPAYKAKVLVVVDAVEHEHCGYLILEGPNPQTDYSQWLRDACKEAGVPPEQRVCVTPEFNVLVCLEHLEGLLAEINKELATQCP